MYFKNQSFLVAGLSKSGLAASELLLSKGAKVYCFDDSENDFIKKTQDGLRVAGCVILSREELERAAQDIDVLVLSPGVPIDNYLPVLFRKSSKRIIGELELAATLITAPVFAVTGTNGKTTTASLISCLLSAGGIENVLCGNIGLPACLRIEEINASSAVCEVSSFQLETLNSLKPHISVITNITPDHLNRHYNMQNYIYLKSKLLLPLRESEYAVLNYDDETVRSLAAGTRGKTVFFSAHEKTDCYLEDGKIYFKENFVADYSQMNIKGVHNASNAMAAIACAAIAGMDLKEIGAALHTFKGVRHRIEFAAEVNGVKYFNDSKGTNVDATVKAVESMDRPTIILLGGKDKGYEYDALFERLNGSNVYHAVLFGENRFNLAESAKKCGYNEVSVCADLDFAIKFAALMARTGDNVLLSPASASFDAFSNYEERGDYFIKKVSELNSNENRTV